MSVNSNEKRLARYIMQLMEGDTHMIGDIFEFLQELGYVGDDQEWIGDNEDEE